MKEIAPSTELRKWFGHDPARWTEFQHRYRAELREQSAALERRADQPCATGPALPRKVAGGTKNRLPVTARLKSSRRS